MHQDRSVYVYRLARHRQCDCRQPGASAGDISGLYRISIRHRDDPRCELPDEPRSRQNLVCPARSHILGDLGCPVHSAEHQRGAVEEGSLHRDLPRMRVGRAWLDEGVVAVVVHDNHSELGKRRENRATGANDDPGVAPDRSQPPSVAG